MNIAYMILAFALICMVSLVTAYQSPTEPQHEQHLPNGYYSFVKADANVRPPKVRKPPYVPISSECPGIYDANTVISKNNLCGDINKGFIPRNPMGQYLFDQPYPFELIKNKTLQFLSKTLPYLKEEIDSIPKVARFMKPSDFFENQLKRYRRQASNYTDISDLSRSNKTAEPNTVQLSKGESKDSNSTKSYRQNGCEGHVICQALESLNKEGPFSKNFLTNVVSAVGNVANLNSVVSLIDQYNQLTQSSSSSNSSSANSNSNKFGISQLLSSVSSLSESAAISNEISPNGGHQGAYSPLLSIIDYIQSLQTPKYAAKRKSSSEPEDYLPDRPDKPQTPCMSNEEYISPTYARNYQGVWKYVVQIPNEGYFTQTIQQTTCLKSKCDLIEGSCRESPRWVSLLVAEIFYPDIYFPANQAMPVYKQPAAQPQPKHPTSSQYQSQMPMQYQVINSNHKNTRPSHQAANSFDMAALASAIKQKHSAYQNMELLARRARTTMDKSTVSEEVTENQADSNSSSSEKKHCDGYDKIGCYVVRVYYDWFLVNGSCKCWKSQNSGGMNINETIKRIFIGKWKK